MGKLDGPAEDVVLGVRPEHVTLAGDHAGELASVDSVEPTGPEGNVVLKVRGQRLMGRFQTGRVVPGQAVNVTIDIPQTTMFSAATGLCIRR